MKRWKCTVCGYIHEGDEAPEICPVCGADKTKFVEFMEEDANLPTDDTSDAPEEKVLNESDASQEDAVKEPVASMENSVVIESAEQNADLRLGPEDRMQKAKIMFWQIYDVVTEFMVKNHAHPIVVHAPNGIVPVSFVFCLLAATFDHDGLAQAAFWNLLIVMLAMPLVLFSGYLSWKEKYGSALTKYFLVKMVCGGIVTICSVILFFWMLADSTVLFDPLSFPLSFIALHAIMLAATGIAGHFGGKLVFGGK